VTPMDPNISRQVRASFDAHDEAFRALRSENTEMGAANAAMGHAFQAHDDAIQAALAANRAALDLLRELSRNGGQS